MNLPMSWSHITMCDSGKEQEEYLLGDDGSVAVARIRHDNAFADDHPSRCDCATDAAVDVS